MAAPARRPHALAGSLVLLLVVLGWTTSGPPADASPPPWCTAADVDVSLTGGDSAMGTVYDELTMTDVSDHACRTGGYGGVSLVAGAGQRLGVPARRDREGGVPPAPFVLAPGGRAAQRVRIANALNLPTAACRPRAARGLRVYVPDETHARFVATDGLLGCARPTALLSVEPWRPIAGTSATRSAGPWCTDDQLRIRLAQPEGSAGRTFYRLDARNVTGSACRIGGYGGVSFVAADGRRLGDPALRVHRRRPTVVVVEPGDEATLLMESLRIFDLTRRVCRPTRATALRVYLPDEPRAQTVPLRDTEVCAATGLRMTSIEAYRPAP